MGKIDVIEAFFESFWLVKAHYREMIVPIAILMLMSGSASIGSGPIGQVLTSVGTSIAASYFTPATAAAGGSAAAANSSMVFPQLPSGPLLSLLGGALLLVIAAVTLAGLVFLTIHQSVTF